MAIRLTEARLRQIIREEVVRVQENTWNNKIRKALDRHLDPEDAPYGSEGGYEEEEEEMPHNVEFELAPERQWVLDSIDNFIDKHGACFATKYKTRFDRWNYGQLLKKEIQALNADAKAEGDAQLAPEEIEYIYTSLCAAEDQYDPEDWG